MDIKRTIYVANLPQDVTEADVLGLFAEADKKFVVESLEIEDNSKTNTNFARVEMQTEKLATRARNRMNGMKAGELYIAVTPAVLPGRDRLSSKQQKIADSIADALGENETVPVRQINAIVMLCGTNFAEAILKETQEVEEAGGLIRHDGEERRSAGGVFFYLARHRMPTPIRKIVYNRKGKMPQPETDDTQGESSE